MTKKNKQHFSNPGDGKEKSANKKDNKEEHEDEKSLPSESELEAEESGQDERGADGGLEECYDAGVDLEVKDQTIPKILIRGDDQIQMERRSGLEEILENFQKTMMKQV